MPITREMGPLLGTSGAPLAAVLRFSAFDLDEDGPARLRRVGHHLRVWSKSRLCIGDAIRLLVVNGLGERAAGTARAVLVQNRNAAARIDPEIQNVADVLVD